MIEQLFYDGYYFLVICFIFLLFFVFAFRRVKCFWTFCVPNKYLKFLRKKKERHGLG